MGEFEEIYEKLYQPLLRLSYGVLKNLDEAEEVLQDVFTKFYLNIDKVKPEAYNSWLYRVTLNESISHYRRSRKLSLVGEEPLSYLHDKSEESSESFPGEMQEIIRKLPLTHQAVLQLRFYDKYQVEEIAELLSLPSGTVKSRLHYALKYLKNEMEKGK